jgi:hypothetical protein
MNLALATWASTTGVANFKQSKLVSSSFREGGLQNPNHSALARPHSLISFLCRRGGQVRAVARHRRHVRPGRAPGGGGAAHRGDAGRARPPVPGRRPRPRARPAVRLAGTAAGGGAARRAPHAALLPGPGAPYVSIRAVLPQQHAVCPHHPHTHFLLCVCAVRRTSLCAP